MDTDTTLELLDWRRRIAELYAEIRSTDKPEDAWQLWRSRRQELFATHPQSPIPLARRATFDGPHYFDYDASYRVAAALEPCEVERFEIPTSGTDPMIFERVGRFSFAIAGREVTLDAYWLSGYAGGLFVPFRDPTAGDETYGAGRYILDTTKGADLGTVDDRVVLDLNFSYNPSCSYDDAWVCPLAPPANRIDVAIRAGERIKA